MEIAEIHGRAAALLTAERTALNFMQRMTGIATLTSQFVDAAAGRITILDTRKTTPLMRTLEKYAVRAGGGVNHRFGLSDGILIKDNHVRLAGGVCNAVARMRAAKPDLPIEVEAQSLSEVADALQAGADIVLLDNLSTPDIIDAVRQCRGRAKTEISGGVTLARIAELAATGADFVSIGALTHSAPAADLSFEMGSRSRSDSMTLPDDLATALAMAGDRPGIFARRILWYAEVGSTNDVAAALADRGEPEGTVVVADAQSAGRGRHGRAWASPPGAGLYMSTLTRPAAHAVGLLTHRRRRGDRRRHSGGNRSSAPAQVAQRHLHGRAQAGRHSRRGGDVECRRAVCDPRMRNQPDAGGLSTRCRRARDLDRVRAWPTDRSGPAARAMPDGTRHRVP